MRTLVISDTHFGAWTGDDLLAHRFARDALAPHLDGIDELVLLGDLFDFLFSSVERAFARADPFFELGVAGVVREARELRRRGRRDLEDVVTACRLGEPSIQLAPNGHGRGRAVRFELGRTCCPEQPPPVALEAYAQVVRNLQWDQLADTFVFAHTHQPLDGVRRADGRLRFWNTGSWIYEPPHGDPEAELRYRQRAWPGTAVLIDSRASHPELVEMLADRNPLARP